MNKDKKASKWVNFWNWNYTSELLSDPLSQAHERTRLQLHCLVLLILSTKLLTDLGAC